MLRHWFRGSVFAALLLVAACGKAPQAPPVEGGPPIWRIEGEGLDGWLFGTIHVLPQNVGWQTDEISTAINTADRLVLESAEIQDPVRTTETFEKMGRSSGLPPIEQRLPAADRVRLGDIANSGSTDMQFLSGYESWAAAMLLSAAAQRHLGTDPDEGVEPVLIDNFRDAGKPIGGLETVARQFSAFDTLSEAAQRSLLIQTVREAEDMPRLYDRILKAWLKGDLTSIAREDVAGAQFDPAVEEAVLVKRNRDWVSAIGKLKGRPFIAVGTGHLTGPDNLIHLLEARGYKLTRVN